MLIEMLSSDGVRDYHCRADRRELLSQYVFIFAMFVTLAIFCGLVLT